MGVALKAIEVAQEVTHRHLQAFAFEELTIGVGRHHIGDGGKGAPLDVDADDLATVGQRVAFVGVQATHPGGGQGKEYAVSTYFSMVARRCL